jgi:hypothetical protein
MHAAVEFFSSTLIIWHGLVSAMKVLSLVSATPSKDKTAVCLHLANHPQTEERESQDQILCIHAHAAQKASCFLSFAFPVHLLT